MRYLLKVLVSFLLVISTVITCIGCEENRNHYEPEDSLDNLGFDASDITSLAVRDYIRLTVEDDLQETFPGCTVDYVQCIYISQEYIEEVYYNSLSNVYFGYDYDEIADYMQDTNWTFTVDENGQTVVREVNETSNGLIDLVKKVAIGTGVIVVCAVVSYVSAGVGAAPVACFFAGAAKGALLGSVSGAAVSGVISGAITGVKTQDWDAALDAAVNSAADGYMWGAITGALVGGFSSAACFSGDTLVKTISGYVPISDISIGDMVYSFNEKTGLYEYQPVTNVTKQISGEIVTLSISGVDIVSTVSHPFYTSDGWVKAGELKGDSMLLAKSGYVNPDAINQDSSPKEMWVYNLTVANTHTYTVSERDVVVHNACGDSAKLRQNLIDAGDVVPDYPNAAHHIVPSSDARFPKAIQARDKLLSLGIDINDANNGVFLTTSKGVTGTTYHRTVHTAEYYDKVNSLLSTATTKSEAIDVLSYIKSLLINGTFMS